MSDFSLVLGHENASKYLKCNTNEERLKSDLHNILKGKLKSGGISIWKHQSDYETERIVAAVTFTRQRNMQYMLFNGCVLIPEPSNGNTLATDINHLHLNYFPPISDSAMIELMDSIANGNQNILNQSKLQKHWDEFAKM